MFLEFEDHECSISFPSAPNSDEDFSAYVTAFGTDFATQACRAKVQTALRNAANARFKAGDTVEEVKNWASSYTIGRGGPRKSKVDKTLTKVDGMKLSAAELEQLRQKLNEQYEDAAD